jgi:hypothetical protein
LRERTSATLERRIGAHDRLTTAALRGNAVNLIGPGDDACSSKYALLAADS